MTSFTRRMALKLMGVGTTLLGWGRRSRGDDAADGYATSTLPQVDRWGKTHDRVWLGESFWANPMEDWRIVDGAAECQTTGGDRNIQLLTHQLTNPAGSFEMSVQVSQVEVHEIDGGAGFRIGTTATSTSIAATASPRMASTPASSKANSPWQECERHCPPALTCRTLYCI